MEIFYGKKDKESEMNFKRGSPDKGKIIMLINHKLTRRLFVC
jgi:hypothetical protein